MSGIVPNLTTPIVVDSVLNNNSWETIKEISDKGYGANYWSVGDRKEVVLNGTVTDLTLSNYTAYVFIIGFNHNASVEGANRIHFQLAKTALSGGTDIAFCDSHYQSGGTSQGFRMSPSNTNIGGWNDSYGRKTLLGNSGTPTSPPANSFMAALPSDLRAVMKSVTKYTDNTGDNSNTSNAVTPTTDYLFFLAEFEVQGARSYANLYEQNYQVQYDYYKVGNSKIKYRYDATGTAAHYWCRSAEYDDDYSFCLVRFNGNADNAATNWSQGLSPAFCV